VARESETPQDLPYSLLDDALRARVRCNLTAFDRRGAAAEGLQAAAVAIVLVPDEAGRAAFLLTRRAARLRSHGGQWALPGGRLDQGESQEGAALRELREELGLALDPTRVLGLLDDYPTRSGFVITPVVLWGEGLGEPHPNPREVASVHRVPVAELAGRDVPRFRSIPESDRPVISIPLLGTQVHAPTAALLYQLVEVAFRGRSTRVAHFEQPVFAWR
jgi:8-oxo-dGTP pyrophosphatase MutT (NUDIX family)